LMVSRILRTISRVSSRQSVGTYILLLTVLYQETMSDSE